ncbi:MAG: hypothetical protein LBK73_02275 [Treponema sp.]|jgi:tRNA-binding EMAP/Myf-like protein|nr:hypothetical protein [Treponema sp.]
MNMSENMANYGDFQKQDIRIGKIVGLENFPKARDPFYKLKIIVAKI